MNGGAVVAGCGCRAVVAAVSVVPGEGRREARGGFGALVWERGGRHVDVGRCVGVGVCASGAWCG